MLIHHQGGDVGIALYHLTEIRILKIGNLHAGVDVVVCRIVYEADKGDGVVEAFEGLIERGMSEASMSPMEGPRTVALLSMTWIVTTIESSCVEVAGA